jgi:hypothetical protein
VLLAAVVLLALLRPRRRPVPPAPGGQAALRVRAWTARLGPPALAAGVVSACGWPGLLAVAAVAAVARVRPAVVPALGLVAAAAAAVACTATARSGAGVPALLGAGLVAVTVACAVARLRAGPVATPPGPRPPG